MMPQNSALTLLVSSETNAKLEQLANHTSRSREFLVGQALDDYLDRELSTIEAIERARAEIRSGHGLTTDDVFRDVDAAIVEVEALKSTPRHVGLFGHLPHERISFGLRSTLQATTRVRLDPSSLDFGPQARRWAKRRWGGRDASLALSRKSYPDCPTS